MLSKASVKNRWVRRGRLLAGATGSGSLEGAVDNRPIVVAYAANPEVSTSVCLIGYRIVSGLAELADADVVAHNRDRDALQRALPDAKFTFVGPTAFGDRIRRIAERLFPGRWSLISAFDLPDYLLFDFCAMLAVRRISRDRPVPYVWRVNPVSFRFPSVLPFLDVPVMTGPHNGAMQWPPGFADLAEAEGDATGGVRRVGDVLHRLVGDVARYAHIVVADRRCLELIPPEAHGRVSIMTENGVVEVEPTSLHAGDASRLVLIARLTRFKAVDVALRVVARLPDHVSLTVIGDGPMRQELEDLARSLGVADRVNFVGHLPHAEVQAYLAQAGVLLFPSVRESGGGVVLEAMSHGLPCVVADWGGPPEYIRDTGLRCRVDDPKTLEDDAVAALQHLLGDPGAARAMGLAAQELISREFLWQDKIARLDAIARGPVAGLTSRKREEARP